MRPLIQLLRPHQYFKNGFIFLPLLFAGEIFSIDLFFPTLLIFIGFSLIASSVYVFNDLRDIDDDRRHPLKKERPFASGRITPLQGYWLMSFLLVIGLSLVVITKISVLIVVLVYLILNIAYSLGAKHLPLIDVIIIAIGFVLRLFVGSEVARIELSAWIVVMTFILALFLAMAKRRDDLLIFEKTGKKMRKSLDGYNINFIDSALSMLGGIVIISYLMYTIDKNVQESFNCKYLYLTSIFVFYGVFTYLKIAFVEEKSGSPTLTLLKDLRIQLTVLLWLISFIIIIYRK